MSDPSTSVPLSRRSPSVEWWLAIAAILTGIFLRLRDLRWQIFSDDEWHALETSVLQSYRHLLTDFSVSAAPPLPLIYKLMHDTVGLTEKFLRLPMFVFGVLILLVFPLVLPSRFGPRTRALFTVLLSLSPILIYYSRYARPYSISLFCAFVGALAFYRWWLGGDRRWAWAFVACAILGPYFHLTVLPGLLAPLGLAFVESWWRQRRSVSAAEIDGTGETDLASMRTPREIFLVGLACGAGLGLLLGAPLLLDWGAIAQRAGSNSVVLATFVHSLPLLTGQALWWVVWTLTLVTLGGAVFLTRESPRFAFYLLWVTLATLGPAMISEAASIQVPIVFVRYTLWIVAVFLLCTAIGFEKIFTRLPAWAFAVATVALGAGLYILGPLPATYGHVNSWTSHAVYQYTYDDTSPFSYAPDRQPERIPDFYRQLAEEPPGSLVIAEAPWYYEWHNNPLHVYQGIHQQWVKTGFLGALCDQPGVRRYPHKAKRMRLRNSVDLSVPEAVGMHGIDYVVLHKDLRSEMPAFASNIRYVPSNNIPEVSEIPSCIGAYRRALGPVIYEDEDLVVLDVRDLKTQSWAD